MSPIRPDSGSTTISDLLPLDNNPRARQDEARASQVGGFDVAEADTRNVAAPKKGFMKGVMAFFANPKKAIGNMFTHAKAGTTEAPPTVQRTVVVPQNERAPAAATPAARPDSGNDPITEAFFANMETQQSLSDIFADPEPAPLHRNLLQTFDDGPARAEGSSFFGAHFDNMSTTTIGKIMSSNTLTSQIEALSADGWTLEISDQRGTRSAVQTDTDSKTIIIGSRIAANENQFIASLAGAIGVVTSGVEVDWSTVGHFVETQLMNDANALFNNLVVRDEIMAGARVDIGVPSDNAESYIALFGKHTFDAEMNEQLQAAIVTELIDEMRMTETRMVEVEGRMEELKIGDLYVMEWQREFDRVGNLN